MYMYIYSDVQRCSCESGKEVYFHNERIHGKRMSVVDMQQSDAEQALGNHFSTEGGSRSKIKFYHVT